MNHFLLSIREGTLASWFFLSLNHFSLLLSLISVANLRPLENSSTFFNWEVSLSHNFEFLIYFSLLSDSFSGFWTFFSIIYFYPLNNTKFLLISSLSLIKIWMDIYFSLISISFYSISSSKLEYIYIVNWKSFSILNWLFLIFRFNSSDPPFLIKFLKLIFVVSIFPSSVPPIY